MNLFVLPFRASVMTGASVLLLAACGGGGSGSGLGGGGPVVVSSDVEPVLAPGGGFETGTLFPLYFVDADEERDVVRGVAGLRRLDATTLELLDPEDDEVVRLVLDGAAGGDEEIYNLVSAGPDGTYGNEDDFVTGADVRIEYRTDEYFSFTLINAPTDEVTGFPRFAFVGGFGYETADVPSSGAFRYDAGNATLFIVSDSAEADDAFYIAFEGDMDLTVNFETGGVEGTVFSGGRFLNLDDDGGDDDRLDLEILMSGTLDGNKIDGTVSSGDVFASLNGGESFAVPLALTNSDVDGQLMGEDTDWINGTWGASYVLGEGVDSISGDVGGFFEAAGDPVIPE